MKQTPTIEQPALPQNEMFGGVIVSLLVLVGTVATLAIISLVIIALLVLL